MGPGPLAPARVRVGRFCPRTRVGSSSATLYGKLHRWLRGQEPRLRAPGPRAPAWGAGPGPQGWPRADHFCGAPRLVVARRGWPWAPGLRGRPQASWLRPPRSHRACGIICFLQSSCLSRLVDWDRPPWAQAQPPTNHLQHAKSSSDVSLNADRQCSELVKDCRQRMAIGRAMMAVITRAQLWSRPWRLVPRTTPRRRAVVHSPHNRCSTSGPNVNRPSALPPGPPGGHRAPPGPECET